MGGFFSGCFIVAITGRWEAGDGVGVRGGVGPNSLLGAFLTAHNVLWVTFQEANRSPEDLSWRSRRQNDSGRQATPALTPAGVSPARAPMLAAQHCDERNNDTPYTIIGGSCHKCHFCRDKKACFVATKVCLPRQTFCRYIIMFVVTKYFCRDKHTFVVTKDVFCRDKHVFVAIKVSLSRQNGLSRQTRICRDKNTCGSSRQW